MEQIRHYSRKREAILNILKSTTTHPTADWVFQKLRDDYPDISLGTVYRNLAMFVNEGTVLSLGTIGGFEHFDAVTVPHTHFICRSCGAVSDLPAVKIPPELLSQAENTCGARPDSWDLRFTGLCPACRASESTR